MESIQLKHVKELKRNLKDLERRLKVKITLKGKVATFEGTAIDEYEASLVLEALSFGFSKSKALLLKEEDTRLEIVNIKAVTRKKNLKEVRARIIGKEGKTLRTLENISGTHLRLDEDSNELGIIGDAISIDETLTGVKNLIRGTKQSNVYRYLEKNNKNKKRDQVDLIE